MSEKVLGFYEEDLKKIVVNGKLDCDCDICKERRKCFVPVVSFEKHKKEVRYWHDRWFKMVQANEKLRHKLKKQVSKR